MQVCKINETCIKLIEKIIFGFIWRAHRSERDRGIDRIKRSILKNKYVEGGLNVTDIECLDRSLKTRQFVRADRSGHPVKTIQLYCIEMCGQRKPIDQGYCKITNNECVTMVAQSTINILNAEIRRELNENLNRYSGDITAIAYAGSMNIKLFLKMSNNKLIECLYKPLLREGVETLHELVGEMEIEHDRNRLRRMRMVSQAFPTVLIQLASTFDEDNNEDINAGYNIMGENNKNWLNINKITTKELQSTLKIILGKVSSQDYINKLGIDEFDKENILKFRNKCKNIKLRHVFYRLISGDIFSGERMFRFGMINNNTCVRCQQIESTRHLLWGCRESSNIWELFNIWIANNHPASKVMNEYQDMYKIDDCSHVCKVKMKIIQEMIQIERPSGWNIDKINSISKDIKKIELYNKNKMYNES